MKRICLLLILFVVTLNSLAQVVIDPKGTKVTVDSSKWKISGANIYNKNPGNVGIGVTGPTAQLHTSGSVRLQGIGTNVINTDIVTADASGNITTRTLSNLLSGNALTSLNGLTNSVQTFSPGTTGTDFNIVSFGSTHTFNFPTASAANRGLLSAANWTTFNNKVGTVTATTPAAVNTATSTATINNTAAYWNANQLQGRDIATSTPTNNQVLTYNTTTTRWEPAAAAPVTTTVSNTNTAPNTLSTTVNAVTGTGVPIINTVANNSATNTLTTTVNGIAGTGVNIINSNALTQNGTNQLVSTVNGVAATALTTNITGDVTGNLGAAVVSKINGSPLGTITGATNGQVLSYNGTAWVPANAAPSTTTHTLTNPANTITSTVNGVAVTAPAVNTVSNNSAVNTLTTTVNGIAGTGVNIINSNALTQNGTNQLLSTVNGVAGTALTANVTGDVTGNLGAAVVSKINGSPLGTTTGATSGQTLAWNGTAWAPANAAPATTTHSLGLSGNTLTSTVNAVAATSNAVGTVSNSSSVNNLTTTVNGVAGTAVPIVNSVANTSSANTLSTTINGIAGSNVNIINSNALSLSSGALTSTVNGVASSPAVNVLATANNGLTAATGNVQLGGALTQATTVTTTASNTLAFSGLQNGASTDSLLVIGTGTGNVIRKVVSPASFPLLLVDARKTTAYTPAAGFATIVYNSAGINVGTAYSTSTGAFTAPVTGLYQILINNGYTLASLGTAQIANRIIVNGTVDMENYTSGNSGLGSANYSLSASTIVSITAGQTVTIASGGVAGTATPLIGTGQHVLKIIRLQ